MALGAASAGNWDTARLIFSLTAPTTRRPGKKGLPNGAFCTKRYPIPTMCTEQTERIISFETAKKNKVEEEPNGAQHI